MTTHAWIRIAGVALLTASLSGMRGPPEPSPRTLSVCQSLAQSQDSLPRGVARRDGKIVLARGYRFRQDEPNRVSVGRMVRTRMGMGFQVTGVFSCNCLSPITTGTCLVINTGTELLCRSSGCFGVCMMSSTGTVMTVRNRAERRQ